MEDAGLISPCWAVLTLADRMKSTGDGDAADAARDMVRASLESAVNEHHEWVTAGGRLGELVKVWGSNPHVAEFTSHMQEVADHWAKCMQAYQAWLSANG